MPFQLPMESSSHTQLPAYSKEPPMTTIDQSLAAIQKNERILLELAEQMLRADDGAIYGVDFLASAAINRAVRVSSGFRAMITARNYMCAAPLIRLQLDTALRVRAGTLVDNPHEFAIEILKGKHVKSIKDRDGKLMNDHYLVTKVEENFPGAKALYKQTSGYIHFSEAHYYHLIGKPDEGSHRMAIGAIEDVPESVYVGAMEAFNKATEMVAAYVASWVSAKENSSLAERE